MGRKRSQAVAQDSFNIFLVVMKYAYLLTFGGCLLLCARAVQGTGGAVVSAVSLSLIMNLFTETDERAKAMGVSGFVCAGAGPSAYCSAVC